MIKNQYQVTWKLYQEWLMENKTKGAKLAFLLFWTLLAIVLFAIIIWGHFSFLYLLLALFCVYRAFFRDDIAARKQYAQLAQMYGCESWIRTITVSDTDIVIEEGTSFINLKKADIARVIEKGDRIYLVMNSKMVVRMYKSAFVEGSWDECRMLLQS